jgi:D-hexose-6-phosphate mutarotase
MEDLVEDFSETKQVNIAIAYLNKEMASQGRQLYDFKIENLEKILYLSGVAATLSDLAVQYFTNALDCVATHEKTYWNDIVDKNLQKAQNYRQIIEHHIGSM